MTTQIARDNKKPSRIREGCNVNKRRGLRLGYFAATQATGADPHALVAGLGFSVHWAQIDVPAPTSDVVRVTDVVAELRAFAADFTNLGHVNSRKLPNWLGKHLMIPDRASFAKSAFGGSPRLQQGELDFSPAEKESILKWALAPGFLEARR